MASPTSRERRRVPRWRIAAAAGLAYTTVVAALVYDLGVRNWTRAYGDMERSGQMAAFAVGQAGLAERSSLLASDPTLALGTGGLDAIATRDLILSDLSPRWGGNNLGTRLADTRNRALDWDDPDVWHQDRVWIGSGSVKDHYLILSLSGSGQDCRRLLNGLSPYSRTRAKVAWSKSSVSHGAADLPGLSWHGPGDALRVCEERGRPKLDVFLLRFDILRTPMADAGAPTQGDTR